MTLIHLVFIFAASIMAGFANAVAGGGTFFSFPALVAGGMNTIMANATSSVAISPGHAMTTFTYRQELLKTDRRRLIALTVIAIGGAICGAFLLTITDEKTFKTLVPYLLGFATLSFAFGPAIQKWLTTRQAEIKASKPSTKLTVKSFAAYFVASIYGGYFGAGQSIVLLTILTLNGIEDIQEANALKNMISALSSLVAVIILAIKGYIVWDLGLMMIVGAMCGGYIGGSIAKKLNKKWMRALVITFSSFLTMVYFYKVYGPH